MENVFDKSHQVLDLQGSRIDLLCSKPDTHQDHHDIEQDKVEARLC